MYVRLGFSIAVNLDPEILLIDEIVAVGDEEFQRRCFDHLYKLRRRGVTIVFVSHCAAAGADAVRPRRVDRPGRDAGRGHRPGGRRHLPARASTRPRSRASRRPASSSADDERGRRGTGEIVLTRVEFLDGGGTPRAGRDHRHADDGAGPLPRATSRSTTRCSAWPSTTRAASHVSGPNSRQRRSAHRAARGATGHVDFAMDPLLLQPGGVRRDRRGRRQLAGRTSTTSATRPSRCTCSPARGPPARPASSCPARWSLASSTDTTQGRRLSGEGQPRVRPGLHGGLDQRRRQPRRQGRHLHGGRRVPPAVRRRDRRGLHGPRPRAHHAGRRPRHPADHERAAAGRAPGSPRSRPTWTRSSRSTSTGRSPTTQLNASFVYSYVQPSHHIWCYGPESLDRAVPPRRASRTCSRSTRCSWEPVFWKEGEEAQWQCGVAAPATGRSGRPDAELPAEALLTMEGVAQAEPVGPPDVPTTEQLLLRRVQHLRGELLREGERREAAERRLREVAPPAPPAPAAVTPVPAPAAPRRAAQVPPAAGPGTADPSAPQRRLAVPQGTPRQKVRAVAGRLLPQGTPRREVAGPRCSPPRSCATPPTGCAPPGRSPACSRPRSRPTRSGARPTTPNAGSLAGQRELSRTAAQQPSVLVVVLADRAGGRRGGATGRSRASASRAGSTGAWPSAPPRTGSRSTDDRVATWAGDSGRAVGGRQRRGRQRRHRLRGDPARRRPAGARVPVPRRAVRAPRPARRPRRLGRRPARRRRPHRPAVPPVVVARPAHRRRLRRAELRAAPQPVPLRPRRARRLRRRHDLGPAAARRPGRRAGRPRPARARQRHRAATTRSVRRACARSRSTSTAPGSRPPRSPPGRASARSGPPSADWPKVTVVIPTRHNRADALDLPAEPGHAPTTRAASTSWSSTTAARATTTTAGTPSTAAAST